MTFVIVVLHVDYNPICNNVHSLTIFLTTVIEICQNNLDEWDVYFFNIVRIYIICVTCSPNIFSPVIIFFVFELLFVQIVLKNFIGGLNLTHLANFILNILHISYLAPNCSSYICSILSHYRFQMSITFFCIVSLIFSLISNKITVYPCLIHCFLQLINIKLRTIIDDS